MPSTIRPIAIALTAVLLGAGALTAQQPARDAAGVVLTGTGIIAGTLMTDERTPRPVRRATIAMSGGAAGASIQRVVVTDDAGRFAFTRLPAGHYTTLRASKVGYVATAYGEKRIGGIGTPVTLAEGQRVTVAMKMLRGAVITGTLRDPRGGPSLITSVRATAVKTVNGERTAVSGIYGSGGTTDDRGVYRIYGLAPGDYVVSASARFSPISSSGELRTITEAELRWGQQQLQPSGGGVMTAPTAPPKPAPAMAYAPVYYPGTTDVASATLVTVAAGQERTGVDFATELVATARIEGTVVDPEGRPSTSAQLNLVPRVDASKLMLGELFFLDSMVMLRPTVVNGKFSLTGVRPGAYTLSARGAPSQGTQPPAGRGRGAAGPMTLWATVDVDVTGEDQTGITMRLEPGMTISGRVVFDGTTLQPPTDTSRVQVRLTPAPTSGISISVSSSSSGMLAPDGTFKIEGVTPGRYTVFASAPGAGPAAGVSWQLRSALVAGVDAADAAFEVRPNQDISNAVVTFTDRNAEISGTLLDAANKPTPDFSIILFPADRTMWSQRSRRIRPPVRASTEGKFKFTNVVPGDYFIAALTDFEPADYYKPEFLEQVAAVAMKIAVAEGDKKVQDLKISGLPTPSGW